MLNIEQLFNEAFEAALKTGLEERRAVYTRLIGTYEAVIISLLWDATEDRRHGAEEHVKRCIASIREDYP